MQQSIEVQNNDHDELIYKPIYLNEDVELITGANNESMLYHQINKKYVRISPSSLEVLKLMDGNRKIKDIAELLQSEYELSNDVLEHILNYLTVLRKAEWLNVKPLPEKGIKKLLGKISKKPMLSLSLVKSVDPVTDSLLSIYKIIPSKSRVYLWYLLALGSMLLYVLFFIFGLSSNFKNVNLFLVVPMVVCNVIIHELAHSVVAKRYGISIREAGVALLYYFIPVAYVNRTDTYRLRDKKSRIQIAIAGPYSDFIIGGMWALIATIGPHDAFSQSAQVIAFIQLLFVFNNFNLLMPTDGYHAVEALVGELSLRRKSLHCLFSVITFRSSTNFVNKSKKRKIIYLTYSIVSIMYFILLVTGVFILFKNGLTLMR